MVIGRPWLGRFVSARGPRADGTYRVLFEVPPKLRPSGWLPTIPLPIEGRRGNLSDPDECARIRKDADALYERYQRAKGAAVAAAPKVRSLTTLVDAWQDSQAYRDTKPRTQQGYDWLALRIIAWDAAPRPPDPVTMLRADIEAFLREFDGRPSLKWHLRKVLRLVMDQAVALGWRTDNPVSGVKVKMPRAEVTIWEQADVDAYVWAAVLNKQPWLGALIMTQWEIGQRLTDAILWRHGADYQDGVFRFRQSKTGAYMTAPVGPEVAKVLAACTKDGSPYLFHDGATGRPFPDVGRLGHVFEAVREHVLAGGGRKLLLRALRHSCVVQLARTGNEVPQIASITGHTLSSAQSILSTYLPRDSKMAWEAQRKRGLIV